VLSALLLNDPIKDKAACYLPKAVTSAASVEEVFSSISPKLIPAEAKYAALKQLNLQIIPLSLRYADMIGSLRHQPYGQNLSLEQRATLALAIDYNIPVLTTNPQWQKLNTGVPILVIGHAQEGRA
jgi:PIN domain nuclease of toxin-antitoxin system